MKQLSLAVLMTLLLSQTTQAMPVEDFTTEEGTWANFGQIVSTAASDAHQVAQGYTQIMLLNDQIKNLNLKNVNNMGSAFQAMSQASKIGDSLVSDSSAGIDKINKWTADQKNPEGRLSALNSVMDTAKATLAVSDKQSQFLKQEAQDVQSIDSASSQVSGMTQAVQASDQLLSHTNAQLQSINTTLAQQNALNAAQAAQRAAEDKAITNHEKTIATTLMNVGKNSYSGGDVPTSSL